MQGQSKKNHSVLALAAFLLVATACILPVQGFHHSNFPTRHQRQAPPSSSLQVVKANTNGEGHAGSGRGDLPNGGDNTNEEGTTNLLGQTTATSRLSHAMLLVPSVDKTVHYWKETAKAQVTKSSKVDDKASDDDDSELRSAFVVLGNSKSIDNCFALELIKNKQKEFQLGNALSYLGISKLIQYASKEDLISVITGAKPKEPAMDEPNGMQVKSCASAPGDFFARFCLHTTNLETTADFYTTILGMKLAAIGDNGEMLCLRYPTPPKANDEDSSSSSSSSFYGVPTTLVFEPLPGGSELDKGNCFDHLVIATEADIEAVYEQLQGLLEESDLNCPIFMKPTEMFGQKVFGVIDPNGYKVILAGKA